VAVLKYRTKPNSFYWLTLSIEFVQMLFLILSSCFPPFFAISLKAISGLCALMLALLLVALPVRKYSPEGDP